MPFGAHHLFGQSYGSDAPGSVTQTGNQFIYSATPTLTVTADNKSKTYGDNNPSLTYTVTGFLDGDTSAILSGSGSVSTTATNTSSAGSYTITAALGNLANVLGFTFAAPVNGTLTVGKAHLTVTADDQIVTQGRVNPSAFTDTISGFVNSETLGTSGVTGAANLSTVATNSSNAGAYTITAALGTLAATNYDFTTFNSGNLTINALPPTGGTRPILPPVITPSAPALVPVPTSVVIAPTTPPAPAAAPAPVPSTVTAVFTNPSTIYNSNTVNVQEGSPSALNTGGYIQAMQTSLPDNTVELVPSFEFPMQTATPSLRGAAPVSNGVNSVQSPENTVTTPVQPANGSVIEGTPANDNVSAPVRDQDNDKKAKDDKEKKARRAQQERLRIMERLMRLGRMFRRSNLADQPELAPNNG